MLLILRLGPIKIVDDSVNRRSTVMTKLYWVTSVVVDMFPLRHDRDIPVCHQVASEEIMKLKKDLEAVRQGEGFYISKESHEEMITRMKELDDQVRDWHEKYSRIKESYEQTTVRR
jgi:hypothetical protein